MKKITSILLLGLLLYNMLGYHVFVIWQEKVVRKEISRKIENSVIAEEDLLTFKIAIPLYHQTDRNYFERVEGEFESDGKFYEMVKQRLENDTLYIYCLKNEKKAKLLANLSDHTQTHFIDFKGKPSGKNENLIKSFLKEYLPFQENSFIFSSVNSKQEFTSFLSQKFFSAYLEILSPPPKQA